MHWILRAAGWPLAADAAQEQAFWDDQAVLGARHVKLQLLAGVILFALWWPTDLWFFHDMPHVREAFALERASIIAIALGTFLLVSVVRFQPQTVVVLGVGAGAALCFAADRSLAMAGGPSEPWFHYTYGLVMLPLIVALKPLHRVFVTTGYAACMVVGYFVGTGWSLRSAFGQSALSFLAGTSALSIAAGLVADGARRRLFFARQSVEKMAAELSELNASLQERVLARTQELQRTLMALDSAHEAERTRIARELHDDFGQQFSGLTYAVGLARHREARGEPLRANLMELQRLMEQLRTTTRGIVTGLRPVMIDRHGLEAAIEALVARVQSRGAVDCQLTMSLGGHTLADPQGAAAYRFVQEALSNAERHAKARHIDVTIEAQADRVVLAIRDDGIGFEPATGHQGFGLLGMRERARALGGTCEITSTPGRGTTVTASFPHVSTERAA